MPKLHTRIVALLLSAALAADPLSAWAGKGTELRSTPQTRVAEQSAFVVQALATQSLPFRDFHRNPSGKPQGRQKLKALIFRHLNPLLILKDLWELIKGNPQSTEALWSARSAMIKILVPKIILATMTLIPTSIAALVNPCRATFNVFGFDFGWEIVTFPFLFWVWYRFERKFKRNQFRVVSPDYRKKSDPTDPKIGNRNTIAFIDDPMENAGNLYFLEERIERLFLGPSRILPFRSA